MFKAPYGDKHRKPWVLAVLGILCFCLYRFTHAAVFPLPPEGSQQIGEMKMVYSEDGDTLKSIAKNHGVSYAALKAANPGVAKSPRPYSLIALPAPVLPDTKREGIVINTANRKLYLYPADSKEVWIFPVAVGRYGWETPTGTSKVINKQKDPVWFVPESIQEAMDEKGIFLPDVVEPGPSNPLGKYAIRTGLSQGTILIHGTNKPSSIGNPVSSGCIRMFNEHVEQVFNQVEVGTPIRIVHQEVLDEPGSAPSANAKDAWVKKQLAKQKETSKFMHYKEVDDVVDIQHTVAHHGARQQKQPGA